MNRRSFLKSLATICGAAVVCPGELLKSKCKHDYRWFAMKNSDAPVWCSSLDYDKHHHYENTCTLCGFTKQILFPSPTARVVIFRGIPVIYESELSA